MNSGVGSERYVEEISCRTAQSAIGIPDGLESTRHPQAVDVDRDQSAVRQVGGNCQRRQNSRGVACHHRSLDSGTRGELEQRRHTIGNSILERQARTGP